MAQQSPAAQLRLLLAQDQVVVAPGVYDGISARMALKAGHTCLYVTGAGTSASYLGRADLGFLAMSDILHVAGMAADLGATTSSRTNRQTVPVIADADTGFGVGPQVARTVTEYHRAGIAALHIEDQVSAKRCGHLDSKQLVETKDFLARIAAATAARDRLPGKESKDKIMIIARTDALAVNGIQDAVDRIKKAKELGADMGFVEGLTNEDEARFVAQTLSSDGWPLLLNHVTGGKTPLWKAQDAKKLGFHLSIFPCAGIFPAMRALEHSYNHLLDNGIGAEAADSSLQGRYVDLYQPSSQEPPRPLTLRQFFVNVGLEEEMEIDAKASVAANSDSSLGRP